MNNKNIKLTLISSMVILSFGVNAQSQKNDIYRYKDSSGNFIYTDKLPKDKNLEVGILSKKTGVIKNLSDLEAARAAKEMSEDEKNAIAIAKVKEEDQIRKDQYILNTYSSVEEIDKIKKYELDQIDRAIKNDVNNVASLNDRKKIIDKEVLANPSNKNTYDAELQRINEAITSSNSSLDKNKKVYFERDKKYNEEMERFSAVINLLNKQKSEIEAKKNEANKVTPN
jgi:hypothetical protein